MGVAAAVSAEMAPRDEEGLAPGGDDAAWGPRWFRATLPSLLVYASFLALFETARLLEYDPFASLWFPPGALTAAAFLVFGARALPAIAAACFTASALTYVRIGLGHDIAGMLFNGLMFTLSHATSFALVAWWVARSLRSGAAPSMGRLVTAFLVGGMVGSLLAAVLGALGTMASGLVEPADVPSLLFPWLIGDYTGLVTLGPLLFLTLRNIAVKSGTRVPGALFVLDGLPRPPRDLRSFVAKLLLVLGVVTAALLLVNHFPHQEPVMVAVFFAIVLQLWIVHTQSMREALVSIAAFAVLVALLVRALGLGEHALVLQFAIISLAASSYYGMAVPMLYADNAQLRQLLIRDALTGAYSRHFFVELSEQAIRQAHANTRPVSMLMIDVDHLKDVNDRHGHAAGDRALIEVVRVCHEALGQNDLFGRLGGDEFCALLPGSDGEDAHATALRMVEAIRRARYEMAHDVPASVSIGVATSDGREDYESLWLRADSALYVAKRNGRNQVAFANHD